MMLRRAALPLVILTGLALFATPADAATAPVSILDDAFSPVTVTVQLGDSVKWQNNGALPHTSTSLQGFWDSGNLSHTQTFSQPFPSAGSFRYECTIHHFQGVVRVRMTKTGSAGSGWTVRWSSASATPAGRNFDVRIKRPGSSTFTSFRSATSALKTFFNPSKAGTYKFEARTRIVSTGMKSGFSPVLTLSIS